MFARFCFRDLSRVRPRYALFAYRLDRDRPDRRVDRGHNFARPRLRLHRRIILGLIGAVLGGWIFSKLGIFGGGTLYSLAAATVGAVVLVAIARLFSGGND